MKTPAFLKRPCFFLFAGMAVATPGVLAATVFTATLTPQQEVPPRASTAYGSAILVLNADRTALTLEVVVHGIDFTGAQTPDDSQDNLTAAHIHAAAFGANGSVVWGFIGNPFNDTNPNDSVVTAFATGVGGTVTGKWDLLEGNGTTLELQLPNLLAGDTYLNFHTARFPGGEIRGQIIERVPEGAGTMGLLGLSLLGLRFCQSGWKRRRIA